jgi:hypothetical protein
MTEKRLRSGQWKVICAFLLMITTIAVAAAIIASFEVLQRGKDLSKSRAELMEVREELQRLLTPETPPPSPLEDENTTMFPDDTEDEMDELIMELEE